MSRAPLPTLRDRRKQAAKKRPQPSTEERLSDILNAALVHRIDGNEGEMVSCLLTAVEVAYGMGKLPSDLTALVDDVASVRRLMGRERA